MNLQTSRYVQLDNIVFGNVFLMFVMESFVMVLFVIGPYYISFSKQVLASVRILKYI